MVEYPQMKFAAASNCVEVVFGTDANGDGELGGYRCGNVTRQAFDAAACGFRSDMIFPSRAKSGDEKFNIIFSWQ